MSVAVISSLVCNSAPVLLQQICERAYLHKLPENQTHFTSSWFSKTGPFVSFIRLHPACILTLLFALGSI